MGIYIKGMEMPKGNYYIDIRLFSDGWAHIPTDEPPYYNRAFEAIELPSHGRLTDADALKETIDYYIREAGWSAEINETLEWTKEFIDAENTIIPAEGGTDR